MVWGVNYLILLRETATADKLHLRNGFRSRISGYRRQACGPGEESCKNMRFCETNRIHVREKTGVKALWLRWMQSREPKISIRFVFHGIGDSPRRHEGHEERSRGIPKRGRDEPRG